MNGPGDIPLTLSSSAPDSRPCGLISIIPTLGMSSCRGRAEAFARRLSSKLRTLGSQTDESISPEGEPIINGNATNTWLAAQDADSTVTDLQPLRHESDSFFDFDCELESPGSPVDECEYLRLIETASNTPHNSATESGYVCASAASSESSTDAAYLHATGPDDKLTLNEHNAAIVATFNADTAKTDAAVENATLPPPTTTSDVTDCAAKAMPANEPSERRTNGHNNNLNITMNGDCDYHHMNDSDMSELSPHHDNLSVMLKPSVLRAIIETTPDCDDHEDMEEAFNIQNVIIEELQKQSEEMNGFAENNNSEHTMEEECALPTETSNSMVATSTTAYSGEQSTDGEMPAGAATALVSHTIQSGISENGDEDILKIVITDNRHMLEEETPAIPCEEAEETTAIACEEAKETPVAIPCEEAKETPTANACEEKVSETEACPVVTAVAVPLTNGNATDTEAMQAGVDEVDRAATTTTPPAVDTTDDEDDCRPQRVRRCSSLKTGKTPPGTPGRKKIVRFADVLGLDLADVKTFLDEVPTIPKSAFEDLEIMEAEPPIQLGPKSDKLLMPLFQQPGGLPTFLDAVRDKQVSLENAAVTDNVNQTITGSVRVRNLDFHKSVHIRYSLDGWRNFVDVQANYSQNSCDGFSDKFTFLIFGNSLQVGQRLEFAVRFQCKGQQFWDNNYGANYCFQCLPSSTCVANNSSSSSNVNGIQATHHLTPAVNHTTSASLAAMLSPTGVGEAWCSSFY